MISLRTSATSFRAKIRTGRRLSGRRKVYQRISPLFNQVLPTVGVPGERISVAREFVGSGRHQAVGGSVVLGRGADEGDEPSALRNRQMLHEREELVSGGSLRTPSYAASCQCRPCHPSTGAYKR